MKHEPDFGEYLAWLDAQGNAKELQVGRYYRRDTGTKAFKLLELPAPHDTHVRVEFYPSGSRTVVEIRRIVEPRAPYPGHYCPSCGNCYVPDDNACYYCGWSVTKIKLPKNYNPATAEAAQTQGDHPMSNTLYRLTEGDTTTYVRRVGTDGSLAVVKDANTGSLRAVDPRLLEEVLPYSVGIKFLGNSTTYHYLANEGQFDVGNLLLADSGTHAQVVAVNTKSRRATKRFEGWKLNAIRLWVSDPSDDAAKDEGTDYEERDDGI